jgi:nucleotide-binding universal stress UspA family protein
MYKHLLIATDGSDLAGYAVTEGLNLAQAIGARATALTVTVPFHIISTDPTMVTDTRDAYDQEMRARAEATLSAVAQEADRRGVSLEKVYHIREHAWEAILDVAKASGCDLIVMASHGRGGLGTLLLGSQTMKVLSESHVPVLVARPPAG